MARARKPIGDDKKLPIDTSGFGFENDEDENGEGDSDWKVGWYQGNNPYRQHAYLPSELEAVNKPSLFTPDVCVKLAEDFDLTEAQVAELARRVEAALDPNLTLLTLAVAQSDGARRGTAAVERGFVAMSDAQDRITDALAALLPLRAIDENGDAGSTLKAALAAIDQCQAGALEALVILDQKLRHKTVLYESRAADKRQVDAARRTVVLSAIFDFWAWAGRKAGYKSAIDGKLPNGGYRSGAVLDLCISVTRLARKDGSSVNNETIVAAIRARKNR